MQALRRLLSDPMALILPAVIFFATLGMGWLVRRLALRALHLWSTRMKARAGEILTEALRTPSAIWILILGVHLAVESSNLPPSAAEASAKLLLVLWILSLTMMFVQIAGKLVRYYGAEVPGALPVTTLTESLAQIAVVILGVLLLMSELGLKITPILTALGVGGLAVALALQDTLSNLFGGFYVAVARQIRLGDYIKLNTGEEGYVTDIGWRCTTIRALANNLIIVPNAKLAQAIVTNYYLPEKRMSASVQVAVRYGSDLDHVESVLLEIAQKGAAEIEGMLADPPPSVAFDPGPGDWSVGFTVSFQVAEFSNQFGVRNELRRRIIRRFHDEGIEIPLPAREVYLRQQAAGGD
jgi:small-conductance mechanosensitive channel